MLPEKILTLLQKKSKEESNNKRIRHTENKIK